MFIVYRKVFTFHTTTTKRELDTFVMDGVEYVSHLLSADDILCFSRANHKSFLTIKKTIHDFLEFSRLEMNHSKSSDIFFASSANREELLGLLRILEGTLPLKYLGVPITSRELWKGDCEDLIGQLQGYLTHWENRSISYDGRVQLANWVLKGKLRY